jgi:hypothetical protein
LSSIPRGEYREAWLARERVRIGQSTRQPVRREEILKRREEQKRQTRYERFEYNRAQRNQATRLLAAPDTNNSNAAPSAAAETKITGEPDASNRS